MKEMITFSVRMGPQPKHLHILVQKPSGKPLEHVLVTINNITILGSPYHRSLPIPNSRYVPMNFSLNHLLDLWTVDPTQLLSLSQLPLFKR